MRAGLIGSAVLLCGLTALGIGCSGNRSLPNLVPVRGVVTFDGKPLPQGTISFVPEEGSNLRAATGEIRQGSFVMLTTASSPGVMPGKYRVLIRSLEARPAPPPPPPGQEAAPMHMITEEAKSLIPVRYADPAKSGLEVEVMKKMDPLRFEITS